MTSSNKTHSSATARLYLRKRDLLVKVVEEGLQRLDGELEAVIEHAATLFMLRRRAAVRADLEPCADAERRLGTMKSPQQDLIKYINGSADPKLSLEGVATEVKGLQQERAMHVSRLGQKLALDNMHCEAALAGKLEGCSDGEGSSEDACDARIAAWYEAELDFIDSERNRQHAFLANLLHVVNTNERRYAMRHDDPGEPTTGSQHRVPEERACCRHPI